MSVGTTTLYVEATAPVSNAGIILTWTRTWNYGMIDTIRFSAVDLDIDSDNNNGYQPPDRTTYEDQIENQTGLEYPGKIVFVNSDDIDEDGVPDYADGFDMFGNQGDGASSAFTPVVIHVDSDLPSTATVTFTYDASDPAGLTRTGNEEDGYEYIPAPGYLRLWNKDGPQSRLKAGLESGGDYIKPGVAYTIAQLGFNIWSEKTLYLESVLEAEPRLPIVAQIDPDGSGPKLKNAKDIAFARSVVVDLQVDTNRTGDINRADDREEDKWTAYRGAIFNVNFDADAGNTNGGHPESDAIAFYDEFGAIEEILGPNGKPIIDSGDEADITPFVIKGLRAFLPADFKLFLVVPELEDIQSIHVFKRIAAGEEAIWGGLGDRDENVRNEPAQPLEVDLTPHTGQTHVDRGLSIAV
jgi:hypothetical protein